MSQGNSDPSPLIQALEQRRSELGDALTEAVQTVLCINEQRCRFRRHLRLNPQATAETYVNEVIERYKTTHAYVSLLQQHKDSATWDALAAKTRYWVYGFLIRWELDEATRASLIMDVAQETCIELLHAHFPYDCEFDAWVCTITHNVFSKYLQRQRFHLVVNELDISETEEWLTTDEVPLFLDPEIIVAEQQWLADVLEQLSPNQKDFIRRYYFEGWPLPQLAAYFQVSVNTIYKRHFDVLMRLRKIIGLNQHNHE